MTLPAGYANSSTTSKPAYGVKLRCHVVLNYPHEEGCEIPFGVDCPGDGGGVVTLTLGSQRVIKSVHGME